MRLTRGIATFTLLVVGVGAALSGCTDDTEEPTAHQEEQTPNPAEEPEASELFQPQVFVRLWCTDSVEVESGVLGEDTPPEAVGQVELGEPQQTGDSCSLPYSLPEASRYVTARVGEWGIRADAHWDDPVQPPTVLTAKANSERKWMLVAVQLPSLPDGPAWEEASGGGRWGEFYLPGGLQPPRS